MKPWILNVGIMSQIPLALPTSCSKKPVEMEKFRSWSVPSVLTCYFKIGTFKSTQVLEY